MMRIGMIGGLNDRGTMNNMPASTERDSSPPLIYNDTLNKMNGLFPNNHHSIHSYDGRVSTFRV
jgi:hypothetical protein